MKRILLVPALGLAAVALAAPARAQLPGWTAPARSSYGADQRAPYYDAGRTAYDNGYREGLRDGERDARRGDRFSYEDEETFRHADRGYHREYGDRGRYQQSFRSGYSAGYSEAYQRIGGYDRGRAVPRQPYPAQRPRAYPDSRGYPGSAGRYGYSPAFDNGRNDGYQKGMEDARKHRSFDPLRHKLYRAGDHDYHGEYGSRDYYRDIYRRGFQEGYARGYRGGDRRYRY